MVIEKVSQSTYNSVIHSNLNHVFDSVAFNELNAFKCNEVHYLLFKDEKYRLGIILGQKGDVFFSPFSAPFGGLESVRMHTDLSLIDSSIDLLIKYVQTIQGKSIHLKLPPFFYHQTMLSKTLNALYRCGFEMEDLDIGHALTLATWNDSIIKGKTMFSSLNFQQCTTLDKIAIAYQNIKKNREQKGYPLRMTFDQVIETTKIIKSDFFTVSIRESGEVIASSMVFHVAKGIVQVIYWGNIQGYESYRSMNFLAMNLFNFYKMKNYDFVDIGPSSENSVPNYGLCAFKEGIGCFTYPKFTLTWSDTR